MFASPVLVIGKDGDIADRVHAGGCFDTTTADEGEPVCDSV